MLAFIVSGDTIVEELKKVIDGGDAELLAALAGDMFGGQCQTILEDDVVMFKFVPNGNYGGVFGVIK